MPPFPKCDKAFEMGLASFSIPEIEQYLVQAVACRHMLGSHTQCGGHVNRQLECRIHSVIYRTIHEWFQAGQEPGQTPHAVNHCLSEPDDAGSDIKKVVRIVISGYPGILPSGPLNQP